MWETVLSNYKYFSCQSCSRLLLLEVLKNHHKKGNISVGSSEQSRDELLNSCKTCLAKRICVDFCKSEILNINICNWYKVLYSACNIIFGISILLDRDFVQLQEWSIVKDRQLCLHKYLEYWVLCPIIA